MASQLAPITAQPWYTQLYTIANRMDLTTDDGKLCTQVYRDVKTLAPIKTQTTIPDRATTDLLNAFQTASDKPIEDTLDNVMKHLPSTLTLLDINLTAPLVQGSFSKATGYTYWAYQCLGYENGRPMCPFERTPLYVETQKGFLLWKSTEITVELLPNQTFDSLFKAAFPKAFEEAAVAFEASKGERKGHIQVDRQLEAVRSNTAFIERINQRDAIREKYDGDEYASHEMEHMRRANRWEFMGSDNLI